MLRRCTFPLVCISTVVNHRSWRNWSGLQRTRDVRSDQTYCIISAIQWTVKNCLFTIPLALHDDKESRVHLQLVRLKIIDFDFFTKQYTWKHSKYPVARHCFLAESQVLVYQAPRETHCTEKDPKTLNAPLHINHILNGA